MLGPEREEINLVMWRTCWKLFRESKWSDTWIAKNFKSSKDWKKGLGGGIKQRNKRNGWNYKEEC